MDPLDDLFSKDGWIITSNTSGKTKIASCNPDETNPFNEARSNWITFHELPQDETSDKFESHRAFRQPFEKIRRKNNDKRVGFYFIRDLLNAKRPNSLSKAFLTDNMSLTKVMVCARITSYEQKNNFYRLILDDGTSSILCMLKLQDVNVDLQDSHSEDEISEIIETPHHGTKEAGKTNSVLLAMKKLSSQRKKFIGDSSINFDQTSLGRPVRIMGHLREFCEKNFIFAFNFRWVSENYFVNSLSYLIQDYEYKENYMLEEI